MEVIISRSHNVEIIPPSKKPELTRFIQGGGKKQVSTKNRFQQTNIGRSIGFVNSDHLIEKHGASIDSICHSLIRSDCQITQGREGKLNWKLTTGSLSEDQFTYGLQINFPEGVRGEFILRRDTLKPGHYHRYKKYQSLQDHFAPVHREIVGNHDDRYVLMQRLFGPHDDAKEGFVEVTSNTTMQKKLASDLTTMVLDLARDGFLIKDLRPHEGHNILFDRSEGRFRLYDPNSIQTRSNLSFKNLIIESLINLSSNRHSEPECYDNIFFNLIRNILFQYPDLDFDGTISQSNGTAILRLMNEETIEACKQGNFERFKASIQNKEIFDCCFID